MALSMKGQLSRYPTGIMFAWPVGVVASLGLAAWLHEGKVRRANQAWEDKWRAREAEWQAGDHRARLGIVPDERDRR